MVWQSCGSTSTSRWCECGLSWSLVVWEQSQCKADFRGVLVIYRQFYDSISMDEKHFFTALQCGEMWAYILFPLLLVCMRHYSNYNLKVLLYLETFKLCCWWLTWSVHSLSSKSKQCSGQAVMSSDEKKLQLKFAISRVYYCRREGNIQCRTLSILIELSNNTLKYTNNSKWT